jgi:integrase/recombinase XerD
MKDDFNICLSRYLKEKEHEGFSLSTLRGIASTMKLFFNGLDSSIEKMTDIKRDDLKSFVRYLVELEKKDGRRKYKTESINQIIGRLRGFFVRLDEKNILKGVAGSLHHLKHTESVSRNILTRKEVSKLFQVEARNLYEFMMKTIFVLLYSTGLRISELLGLKLEDIDYEAGTLLVYEKKEKKERYVHTGDVGLNYLRLFINHARHHICYDAKVSNIVFLSNYRGKLLSSFAVNRHLKAFLKRAGIKKNISTHSFRHSYGSHLLENGAEIKHISELLGHKKLSTTERYTHLNPENLREVIRTFHPREHGDVPWN